MSAHVFLGPTLTADSALRHLDAVYHPPAEQGDVLRVLEQGARSIGIIDGYFQFVPSVWHKEVLLALEQGVAVYGAASMGALRAAELWQFGMVGVGVVYDWYVTGTIEDDDEVAVAHAPAEFGYQAFSEAMVNIRDALSAAVTGKILTAQQAEVLISAAKALHYPERSFERLLQEAPRLGVTPYQQRRLEAFIAALGPPLKERDAVALLQRMATDLGQRRSQPLPDWRVERTVFLADLLTAVGQESGDPEHPVGETSDVARKKALLRILARREASRAGLEVGRADVQATADAFRAAFSLNDEAATVGWLRMAGLTRESFAELMRDAALIEAVQDHHAEELNRAAVEQARLSTARLWARHGV